MKESRKEEIKSAYRNLGRAHSFYDGMMTGTTWTGRWILTHIWHMTRDDLLEYQSGAFEAVPKGFAGKLLEIPVGTGVLSMPVFKTLPKAEIICADYSEKMMSAAEQRAAEMGIRNIKFIRGDVGDLSFPDDTFDAVVSLNGFHAFPDKEAAYHEIFRVLKPGGVFCGCFYVEGVDLRTDRRIRFLYIPMGFFTPPFETVESLRNRLNGMYSAAAVRNVGSIAYFQCVK